MDKLKENTGIVGMYDDKKAVIEMVEDAYANGDSVVVGIMPKDFTENSTINVIGWCDDKIMLKYALSLIDDLYCRK